MKEGVLLNKMTYQLDPQKELYITYFNVEGKHEHTSLRPVLPTRMSRLATAAESYRSSPRPSSPIPLCKDQVFCFISSSCSKRPSPHSSLHMQGYHPLCMQSYAFFKPLPEKQNQDPQHLPSPLPIPPLPSIFIFSILPRLNNPLMNKIIHNSTIIPNRAQQHPLPPSPCPHSNLHPHLSFLPCFFLSYLSSSDFIFHLPISGPSWRNDINTIKHSGKFRQTPLLPQVCGQYPFPFNGNGRFGDVRAEHGDLFVWVDVYS